MGALQLSDPFSIESFEDMMKSMFRPVRFEMVAPTPSIKLEVTEEEKFFHVKAEIPGMKKEDIKIKIDGDTVSISAESRLQKDEKKNGKILRSEFHYGAMSRAFSLGTEVDAAKSEAKYENGILELMLSKKPSTAGATLAVR